MILFLQQGHTYSNKATRPNSTVSLWGAIAFKRLQHICACVHWLEVIINCFFILSLPLVLKPNISFILRLINWVRLPSQWAWGICLTSSPLSHNSVVMGLYHYICDLNISPYACLVWTLPTEPSPQPQNNTLVHPWLYCLTMQQCPSLLKKLNKTNKLRKENKYPSTV